MKGTLKIVLVALTISLLSTSMPLTQTFVVDKETRYEDIAKFVEIRQREQRVQQVLASVKTNLTTGEQKDLARIIARESLKSGFSVEFVMAVIKTESSFNKFAKSPVGAIGLMQLMPSTGKAIAEDYGIVLDDDRLYNPQINVTLGIRYLKRLTDRFKDMNMVLAAYNMGPTKFRTYRQKNGYPVFKYTKMVRRANETIEQL